MNSFVLSILVLFIAMISIQVGASLAKQLFSLIGAPGTTALRVGFAALMLALVFRPWKFRISKKFLLPLLIYGSTLGLMNYFFYLSLERIPLGIAVALEFTGPLGVALFLSKKPIDIFWALLASLGIILILPLTANEVRLDSLGILFALMAGSFWALYILSGKRASFEIKGAAASTIGMFVAAVVVLPIGIYQTEAKLLDLSILPLALTIALFSSAVPYSLEMVALKRLPSHTFGILMSIEPAIAALAGLLILNEKLSLNQWIAILCIILASAGASYTTYKRRSQ